ncbi:MAG: NAD(P)H-dependent oxidoreductase [Rhodospirillaceae bacterium]
MSKFFILNGAQPYPFAKGTLNATFADKAREILAEHGHDIRQTVIAEGYEVDQEVENHRWADVILMQFPVNWMSVSWSFKKYMDEVYTAGMDGRLCAGDGRTAEAPKANYGMGGTLTGKRYMLSVTFNAPGEAFNDPTEPFFQGASVDDLLRPVHLNAKFFGMDALPTFAAFDVMKNPTIAEDLERFAAQMTRIAQESTRDAA